ncbi:MAG: UDP-N-acetylglucosamine 2-epimerase (hydrolyzing) [Alphaproteobacteria bacterium]|nr:MAG: UDP-N-acetylglucosamine 2-epimerase (hydrolyzing) [Alphaproteobacteria bacterium]
MDKILLVIGSRADYWLLRNLAKQLQDNKVLVLVTSGECVSENFDQQLEKDGLELFGKINCLSDQDSYLCMTQAISEGIKSFSGILKNVNPKMVVLLGDRYETMASAVAAYSMKIPISHIHGGEVTHGAIDDGYRHAISKLSSFHFVSHEKYKERLLRMGEQPDRVHVVGALGLDNLPSSLGESARVLERYNLKNDEDFCVLTYHSETYNEQSIKQQLMSIKSSLLSLKNFKIIITKANSDPGGVLINKVWAEWVKNDKRVKFIPTLGDDFLKLLAKAKFCIGNSSSGIIEIPYLNVPVVNIGNRQEGRIFPRGVFKAGYESDDISAAINRALNFSGPSEKIYKEPGKIGNRVCEFLFSFNLEKSICKKFYDGQ